MLRHASWRLVLVCALVFVFGTCASYCRAELVPRPPALNTSTDFQVRVSDDALPTPQWVRTGCTPPFTECALIESYKMWSSKNKDRLSFYVERLQADPVGAVTVWIFSDATSTLALVEALHKTGVNVIRFHPRGGRYSNPHLVCSADAVSVATNCWPDATCAQQLRDQGVSLEQFAIANVARDVQWVLSTLGRGTRNVLLSEGTSAAIVLHYLALFPNEVTSDVGVVFVDPIYPGLRTEAFDAVKTFYQHVDAAAQHLLSLCDEQPLCAARLGAESSAWARLQNVLQAVATGALPCVENDKLKWVTSDGGTDQNSAVRQTLAALVAPYQFFAQSDPAWLQVVPSVLYRLQRCTDADVRALSHLQSYLRDGAHVTECPANTALYTIWLANEFHDAGKGRVTSGVSPQTILDEALKQRRVTLVPGHHAMSRFVAFDETIAHYKPEVHMWNGTYTGQPQVLLLTSDMDAVLPSGLSAKLALRFRDVTAHQLRGGGAAHLPSNEAMRTCLANQLHTYMRGFTWGDRTLCVPNKPDSVDFITFDASLFYGEKDAWAFTVPLPDEPTDGHHRGDEEDVSRMSLKKKLLLSLAVLCVTVCVAAGAYYGRLWYIKRRYEQAESDDFFDYLH